MSKAVSKAPSGPKALVLQALQKAAGPVDAYQVAKASGVSPMQAGRTLIKLMSEGLAQTTDELDTANPLAACFTLKTDSPQPAMA